MTFDALRCLRDSKILVVGLPSHTSADLQPLDVSVFKPVKTATATVYRGALLENFQDGLGIKMDSWDLPPLLYTAWRKGATKSNVMAGFKATGIWPVQADWVDKEENKVKLEPSALFYKPELHDGSLITTAAEGEDSSDEENESSEEDDEEDVDELSDSELLVDPVPPVAAVTPPQPIATPSAGPVLDDIFAYMGAGKVARSALTHPDFEKEIRQVASNLGLDPNSFHKAAISGMTMVHAVQHTIRLPTPEETAALLVKTHKKPAANKMNESQAAAKILNTNERIARGVIVTAEKLAELEAKDGRRDDKMKQHHEEMRLLKAAHRLQVIAFGPYSTDDIGHCLTSKELVELCLKLELIDEHKRVTNKSFKNASRKLQAEWLLRQLDDAGIETKLLLYEVCLF
eukprot:gene33075-40818_t